MKLRLTLLTSLLLLLSVMASAQVKLPDTPAGKRMAELLAMIETADGHQVQQFVRSFSKQLLADIPEERHLQVMEQLHDRTGGLELAAVETSSPSHLVVVARTKKDGDRYLRIELQTEETAPYAIAMIGLRPAPAPASAETKSNTPSVSNSEINKRIDEYLSRLSGYGFSGTALIAKDGQIIFHKGYGLADRAKNIANTDDTVFDLGSVAKQFTAAAIMKLEMMGKLNTNDAISKYLNGVPADKQDITIHQLLSMTSGVIASPGPDGSDAVKDRDKRVQQILNAPLNSRPGSRFQYSNDGYNLAAAIVERVSGQSLEQFEYEQLFRPAGMTSTGFMSNVFIVPGWTSKSIARLYDDKEDNGYPWAANEYPWFLKGPGNILSSPADLYKWHLALLGDKILSAAAKKKLYTPVLNDYAYGWDVIKSQHGTLIQHNGGTSFGAGNNFIRYVDAGVTIIFSLNRSGEQYVDLVSRNLTALTFGESVTPLPAVIQLTSGVLEKYAGKYKLTDGSELMVSPADGGLLISATSPEGLRALFNSGSSERIKELEARTLKVAEATLKADYVPLHEAFAGRMPFEQLKARQEQVWKGRGAQYGALKGCKLIGTTRESQGDAGTTVRFDFERGSIFLQYIWGPRALAAIRVLDAPPGLQVLPLSDKEFARLDLASGGVARISFTLDAAGGVAALSFNSGQQRLTANRVQ